MSLEELISTYGYAAIAIGTFAEGETVLILGGLAAHRGYLQLPWVMICAFIGTWCSGELYFYMGRAKGTALLEKRPRWKSKSERVLGLLRRHQLVGILGFRLLYGLRTITPFLLGVGGISAIRFLVLNAIGAFFWAAGIGILGYLFGHALETILGDIERYESHVFAAIVILGVIAWCVRWLLSRRESIRQAVRATP